MKKLFYGVMEESSHFILSKNIEVFDEGILTSEHLVVFKRDDGKKPKESDLHHINQNL